MTNDEYSSLVAKVGSNGAAWCIDKLDNYKGSTGKKYDNDYRTILSWVIARYNEHLQAQSESSRNFTGQGSCSAHNGYCQPIDYNGSNSKYGDAFEDYVYKKIEEAKRHGTL